jgi:phage gp45-like
MVHRSTPLGAAFRGYVGGGSRCNVDTIDDSKLMQEMSGTFMNGESRKAIEAAQNYGFSSHNMPADKDEMGNITGCAEVAMSFMGGSRSYPIAGNMDDRRHRLKGLEPGDTAMFRTKNDFLQMHFSQKGGFMSGARNRTLRFALVDKDAQDQQQQGGQGGSGGGGGSSRAAFGKDAQISTRDSGGGGGGGSGGSGGGGGQGQNKPTGQTHLLDDNQSSKRFMHMTQDETAHSGSNVRQYLDDGNGYHEINKDKNVYTGALKGKGKFAKVVTTSGPCKNVWGFLG